MRVLGRPTHKRNLQQLIEEYRRTLPHSSSFELREFAVWAIRERRRAPPIKSAVDLLVSEAGAALREEYFTDDQGRRVRKKHVVRVWSEDQFGNKKQLTFWNDITTAPPEHMLASLQQRRIGIADDCWPVITNHNKFDLDEFKTLAKVARKENIFLLPGLELSVKDGSNGIHMLAVFSDEWISNKENVNYVQSFLNVTFAGQANFENKNGRSNHDLNDTIRELDKFERDYFLICAHVEADNGLWGGLREGGLLNWGSQICFHSDALASRRSRHMTSGPR
jgi:hypothetical protein